jgi:hypothetical protein
MVASSTGLGNENDCAGEGRPAAIVNDRTVLSTRLNQVSSVAESEEKS